MNSSASLYRNYIGKSPVRCHTIYIKDPASAISHFIGAILSLGASVPLLIKAAQTGKIVCVISMLIYALSLVALYSASTAYHTIPSGHKYEKTLKKLDHMMIFVLISGSYTPVCLLSLSKPIGYILLCAVWGISLLGMCFKYFWVCCPKWISSVLYIALGWACIFAFPELYASVEIGCFLWLLAGGVIYTLGGIVYALRISSFEKRHVNFGFHEIFHLFVMAGSFCHYIVMYVYLI